jgi:hypothetical protein
MIAELVYFLLSILIRFTPLVGTRPITRSRKSLNGNDFPGFAIWIPVVGWVVVSVQRSFVNDWLPQRVVAARWLGWFATPSDEEADWTLQKQPSAGSSVSRWRRFRRLFEKSADIGSAKSRRRI